MATNKIAIRRDSAAAWASVVLEGGEFGYDTTNDALKLGDGTTAYSSLGSFGVGTVSQSGGTPTGAVIERGSNANGEYVKFADGTMICTVTTEFTATSESFVSSVITLPATFVNTAYTVSGVLHDLLGGGVWFIGRVDSRTTTSIRVIVYERSGTARTGTSDVDVTIVGRWY